MPLSYNDMYKLAMNWFQWWASDRWIDIKFHQDEDNVYYSPPDNTLRHMKVQGKVVSMKFNEAYGRLNMDVMAMEEVNEITLELTFQGYEEIKNE